VSGETIVVWGTQKTLESNGSSITNNSVVQADDANYDIVADSPGGSSTPYPDAEFVLTCTFGTGPTEGTFLALYARPLDIDGTADTEVPEATRGTIFIGTFTVNNVTSSQTIAMNGIYASGVPKLAAYYLHNNGTGQTVSSGWTLKVTPRSYKAA
jgi:hypothetical protein